MFGSRVGVFGVGGSNGAISIFIKSKMAAGPPSWKFQMAISLQRVIRFIPCLVLEGFSGTADLITLFPVRPNLKRRPPSWKIQMAKFRMATSLQRIIRSTSRLVLG